MLVGYFVDRLWLNYLSWNQIPLQHLSSLLPWCSKCHSCTEMHHSTEELDSLVVFELASEAYLLVCFCTRDSNNAYCGILARYFAAVEDRHSCKCMELDDSNLVKSESMRFYMQGTNRSPSLPTGRWKVYNLAALKVYNSKTSNFITLQRLRCSKPIFYSR